MFWRDTFISLFKGILALINLIHTIKTTVGPKGMNLQKKL